MCKQVGMGGGKLWKKDKKKRHREILNVGVVGVNIAFLIVFAFRPSEKRALAFIFQLQHCSTLSVVALSKRKKNIF